MRFYATLPMGLEKISAEEIRKIGGKVLEIKDQRGRVFFEGKDDLIPKLNFLSRTLERVMVLLGYERINSLDDIYACVKKIDFSFIKPNQSFAIRSLRVGEHNFTSIDISREAGQAVIDSYLQDKKVRLRVDLDKPDIIVRADLIHDELFIGLDTTGDKALHKRWYRVYNHPAPLNTAIASSMIFLSGWRKGRILFDPMCGGGTIPIEAAMILRNIPPGKNREFSYFKFLGEIIPEYDENTGISPIYGSDKFKKHVEGAKRNAREAGVEDTIEFFEGDILEIKDLETNFIITNPPYGLRIGRKRMIEDLYRGFFDRCSDILVRESIIVMITPYSRLVEDISKDLDLRLLEKLPVKYGNLDTTIFKLKM